MPGGRRPNFVPPHSWWYALFVGNAGFIFLDNGSIGHTTRMIRTIKESVPKKGAGEMLQRRGCYSIRVVASLVSFVLVVDQFLILINRVDSGMMTSVEQATW
jgi:hypothetical protein